MNALVQYESRACQTINIMNIYVNMADPFKISSHHPERSERSVSMGASPLFLREDEIRRGAELLYFGYTRLTKSIDEELAQQGLGRAHHRALYFIARKPDLTVGELLKFLAITKQSLGRVLSELTKRNLIENRSGTSDRRQRLLRLTENGVKLEAQLFDALRLGLSSAYTQAGQDNVSGFWRVLEGLIPEDDLPMIAALRKLK